MAEEAIQEHEAGAQAEPNQEPQATAARAEPQGEHAIERQADATDWKAEARKWERRAKENSAAQGDLQAAKERAEKAEAEVDALKHQKDLADWAAKASAETGIPQSVIRGGSYEEMLAHAQAIKSAVPIYPVVEGQRGGGAAPQLTKESILAIKDAKERREAIARNIDLFNE